MPKPGPNAEQEIRTARLTLRRLVRTDAATVFDLQNDREVVRMLAAVPWPLRLADVEDFAARQGEPDAESRDFVLRAGDRVIGVAGVRRPGSGDPPRKMPRMGYWIGRAHWGKGYGGEAVAAITALAFASFPHDRVGAGVFHDNPASRRILERLGFEAAGFYDTVSLSRGVPVPTVDMHLTRAKFESIR